MPKALCIAAMAISILVLILFLSDLLFGMVGPKSVAPFKGESIVVDIIFSLCAAVVGFLSYQTLREQV